MDYERRSLEPMTVTVADSRYAEFAYEPCPADKPVSLPPGFTADEVELMWRERNRAVSVLEFGAIADSPFTFPPPVPMIDWERIAAGRAHECAVMVRALRMAKAKIARLEATIAPALKREPTVSETIAATFLRSTVTDSYGRY